MSITKTLLPDNTLGILGGGQIARMTAQSAISMGYKVAIFEPDPHSPAATIAQQHIIANYDDNQALLDFAKNCVAVSTEFENVPAQTLAFLQQHTQVCPPPAAVAMAQDRELEKQFFQQHNIGCAPFKVINTVADIVDVGSEFFPAILKTSKFGYDGKGQVRLQNQQQLADAWQQLKQVPCILEKMLNLKAEYSIIVARGFDGSLVNLPVQRNHHHNGILAITEVGDGILASELTNKLINIAKQIALQLEYVGVLCIEFFLLEDGQILANELAPRPHNSGHHSIDSCDYSQFELQVRTMAKLPLVQPHLHSPCVLINLLGDLWFSNNSTTATTPAWDKALALDGVHLHLYGKQQARKGRKMGHITITANNLVSAQATAQKVIELFNLPYHT